MNRTDIGAGARERLHRLILVELADKGFERIDLPRTLWSAGVSESVFEAAYEGVEDCVFAAYDEEIARLDSAVREACRDRGAGASWAERVSAGLSALLAELSLQPEIARAIVRSFPAVSPRARARSQAFNESFAPMLAGGRDASGIGDQLPREVELLTAGAAEALIFEAIEAGRGTELPSMLPSLVFSVLVPFLGPERAAVEMERVRL
jgi:hypothetical protein